MQENYSDSKWLGKKFNSLTVIGFEKGVRYDGKYYKQYNRWICECDCGNKKSVLPNKVIRGTTKTCGCGKPKRLIKYNIEHNTKHGGRKEYLYSIWHGIKARCYNSNSKDYKNYGARGITMCDEWKDDYAAFREWSTNHGYSKELTIDRIDVNGNYEPDNCRWVDNIVQARNQRRSVKFLYNGKERCLAEISEMTGILYQTLYGRLFRHHWTFEEAIQGFRNKNIEKSA